MINKRRDIIREVSKLAKSWIQYCLSINELLPKKDIERSSCYIFPFGSYELNAHFPSSDIDLLCVGPKQITRDMLFTEFVKRLESDIRVTNILVSLIILFLSNLFFWFFFFFFCALIYVYI